MASGTEEFQFAVRTCSEHSHEELFSYCNTCHKSICELCVKGEHRDHDWTSISKHVREIRREANTISKKIREVIIPSLRTGAAKTRKNRNRREITQRQQALKDKIDAYANLLLSVVDKDTDDIPEVEGEIQQFIKIADFFENHIHSSHENVVLDIEEEFKEKEEQMRKWTQQLTKVQNFKKGTIAEVTIKYMFGHMVLGSVDGAELKASFLRDFTFGKMSIIGIVAMSKTRAWVHVVESPKNELIDDAGKSLEQINYGREYNSFIVEGKRHIFTSVEDEAVLEHTDGKVRTSYETSPYFASGICKSRDGGIIVCLIEGDRSEITPATKGEVHHIDMSGKLVKKYVTEKDTNSNLFKWPNKVDQNVNLDLCVLDFVGAKENDRLVTVSLDNTVRFTYSGQPNLKKEFAVGDVICDSTGNIYLADFLNDAIHIISEDGNFLQFLLTKEDNLFGPCSFSFYEDTLWIGCTNGVVKIYQVDK